MSEKTLHKIDDKMQLTEVYHLIMKASMEYAKLSPNIPKALLEVQQHIHGRFDSAAYYAQKAANTRVKEEKLQYLHMAIDDIFYQYNSIEYLVKTKSLTVGAANNIIDLLSDCHSQLKKWLNFVNK